MSDKEQKHKTIPVIIYDKLKDLELNRGIDKIPMVLEIYGLVDYFTKRTFDVNLVKAKAMMPTKKFRCVNGIITRQQ